MKYRKIMAVALAASLIVPAGAVNVFAEGTDTTEITLWTYPVGNWGDSQI